MKRVVIGVLSVLVLLSGCATVTVDQEFSEVSKEATSRTGESVRWEQTPEDEAWTRQMVQELLKDGVTREEAVRLALLNNRTLQVQFETLGIAKSDLIQAGLYSNPSIGSVIRFPASPALVNTESDMLFLVSDLWNVPLRRQVAAVEVVRATQSIVQEILETAAEARNVFDELLLQEALLQFEKRKVSLLQVTLEQIDARFNAGLANQVDVFLGQNVLYEAQVELTMVEAAIKREYAAFVATLGLDPFVKEEVHIHGDLEHLVHSGIEHIVEFSATHAHDDMDEGASQHASLEEAWDFAMNHRVDLALTRLQIVQTKKMLTLQKARIFGDVGLGPNYSRSSSGLNNPGLALALEIPVFNQNQGGIARAEFQVRQAEKQMIATELQAKQEIQRLLAKLNFHETHVRLFRENMRATQESVEDYVDQFYRSMQFNTIYLVQIRQRNLDVLEAYLKALRQYRLAESMLQVALGGQLPESHH